MPAAEKKLNSEKNTRTGRAAVYFLYGFGIAIGAIVGSVAWFFVYAQRDRFLGWVLSEIGGAADVYGPAAGGVIALFSLVGFVIGWQADRADAEQKSNVPSPIDEKTGLHTSAHLHEELSHAFEFSKRYNTPLTCILFDIDNFTRLKQTHGGTLGDEVLAAITGKVKLLSRRADSAGQLNGEEFLLIMPSTSTLSGRVVAERLRNAVANLSFKRSATTVRVTLSAGVAMFPSGTIDSKSSLLRAAAQALYKAKESGKNQTVVWDSEDGIKPRQTVPTSSK